MVTCINTWEYTSHDITIRHNIVVSYVHVATRRSRTSTWRQVSSRATIMTPYYVHSFIRKRRHVKRRSFFSLFFFSFLFFSFLFSLFLYSPSLPYVLLQLLYRLFARTYAVSRKNHNPREERHSSWHSWANFHFANTWPVWCRNFYVTFDRIFIIIIIFFFLFYIDGRVRSKGDSRDW